MAKFQLSINNRCDTPPGRSAWELFLLGVGVTESSCTLLLTGRSHKGRAIRSWVREHYAKRYVPEEILETLGLRRQLKLRWQGDE